MDMYQKREQRRKLKSENIDNKENNSKMNINWLMETYGNTHSNLYKIRILTN